MVKTVVFYDENNISKFLILWQNESEIKSRTLINLMSIQCMVFTFRMVVGTVVEMLTQKYQWKPNAKLWLCRILPKLWWFLQIQCFCFSHELLKLLSSVNKWWLLFVWKSVKNYWGRLWHLDLLERIENLLNQYQLYF